MTADASPADGAEPRSGVGRRHLLRTGGLVAGLAAVLAACGKSSSSSGEPGRVGYAPTPTDLPKQNIDDGVRLRTATSIEYTIMYIYATITKSGVLQGDNQALVDRLIVDHQAAADRLAQLTTEYGAEPYECENAWYMDRVVPPIFENIDGDEAKGIPPTDDPARDMLATVNAWESMDGAMYQGMVETMASAELRSQTMVIGAMAGRHAAVSAIHATGAPKAYFDPSLIGGEAPLPENGLLPLFAIPTEFGSLAPTQLVIGAPSSAGTRFTLAIDTPAENSYVYTDQSCPST
jgi:hypothetical protein